MNVLDFIFGVLVLLGGFTIALMYLMFKFDKIEDTRKNYTEVYKDVPKTSKNKKSIKKNEEEK